MCITLNNAVIVALHITAAQGHRSYTRTIHPANQLEPGDWIQPFRDDYPRIVFELHRTRSYVRVIDHWGCEFRYRRDDTIATAVPDPIRLTR